MIDLLFSLAYLYFCLLFEHLVPLVLSLPCLQSHHLANQTFFHSVKLRCALSRACPLQLHPAGENHVVEDERFWVGIILAAMNLERSSMLEASLPSSKRQKWCYLTEKHEFFQAPLCMQHASSFHHASWIFVLKAVLVHTPAFHELNFFCGKRSATFTEKLSILVFEQQFVLHQVIIISLIIPLHFLLLRCRWKISLFGNRGWTGKMFRLLGQVIASWRFYCDWFVLASQGKWVHNIKILCCELEATLNCQTMFLLSGFSMATSTVAMLMT